MQSSRHSSDELRRRPTARDDDGSASLEFITVGLVLLVPIVYLIVALAEVQAAVLAAGGAAAQAAKLYARADDDATGRDRVEDSLALALDDFGLDRSQSSVTLDCAPAGLPCGQRGGAVTVTVDILVVLPLMPDIVGVQAAVPVTGVATAPISRFDDRFGEAE
ncbi:hypothetical protein [Plantibacter cousiniae (nom. nud.)]|uniref:TadE family protein n=1 Tax=Plantibacter cousiniae (nom. nud.) TaxID=199709 RepID=A0ABY1LKM6_9MICO|nr:hypothetical protein [Plantibacter cousiniae]SKC54021.1 hypothetical protein SAMN06295973_1802 [Plantibacter cousiniae]